MRQRQTQTSIKPALGLTEKIQIILSDCRMSNRDKIDCILVLAQSEIDEKDICLNREKIRQQLLSEILYLFAKIEKNQAIMNNKGYIYKRINLAWTNCREQGWTVPRNFQEQKYDYLENLQKKQVLTTKIETKKEKKKKEDEKKDKRNSGWHTKTWRRYERFYLGHDIEVEKKQKRQPTQLKLPLSGLTPNKNKEVE